MKILWCSYDSLDNPFVAGGGAVQAKELQGRLRAKGHAFDWLHVSRPECLDGYVRSRLRYSSRVSRDLWACAQRYDVIVYEFSPWSPLWVPDEIRDRVVLAMWHRVPFSQMVRKVGPAAPLCWVAQRRAEQGFQHRVCLAPRKGWTAIPPGVDDALFEMKPEDKGFALYMGRLDIEQKGLDRLIRMWGEMGDAAPDLWIRGRGDSDAIFRLAMRHNNIFVRGEVSEEVKRASLRTCSFVVMPSRYEGWGIAAVEAQAAGKVVIGWDIPGLRDALAGESYIPSDESDFKECVRYLAAWPYIRARLGLRARTWARRYTWDACADRWETYLKGIARA